MEGTIYKSQVAANSDNYYFYDAELADDNAVVVTVKSCSTGELVSQRYTEDKEAGKRLDRIIAFLRKEDNQLGEILRIPDAVASLRWIDGWKESVPLQYSMYYDESGIKRYELIHPSSTAISRSAMEVANISIQQTDEKYSLMVCQLHEDNSVVYSTYATDTKKMFHSSNVGEIKTHIQEHLSEYTLIMDETDAINLLHMINDVSVNRRDEEKLHQAYKENRLKGLIIQPRILTIQDILGKDDVDLLRHLNEGVINTCFLEEKNKDAQQRLQCLLRVFAAQSILYRINTRKSLFGEQCGTIDLLAESILMANHVELVPYTCNIGRDKLLQQYPRLSKKTIDAVLEKEPVMINGSMIQTSKEEIRGLYYNATSNSNASNKRTLKMEHRYLFPLCLAKEVDTIPMVNSANFNKYYEMLQSNYHTVEGAIIIDLINKAISRLSREVREMLTIHAQCTMLDTLQMLMQQNLKLLYASLDTIILEADMSFKPLLNKEFMRLIDNLLLYIE